MEKQIIVVVKALIRVDGKFLIVQRASHDETGAGFWEMPGGKIDFGEQPETALVREVKEEVDLDVEVGEIGYVTSFLTSPHRQIILLAYHCRAQSTEVTLSLEHTAYQWVEPESLHRVLPQDIIDDLVRGNVIISRR